MVRILLVLVGVGLGGLVAAEPSGPVAPSGVVARSTVSLDALVAGLEAVAQELEASEAVRRHWETLAASHGLKDTPENYRDFVRVRLVHEALRAGGWAGLAWGVTNEPPQSDAIWRAWMAGQQRVVAECDELSALFAFIARRLGVREVGLFWPTWNHTVAVWTAAGEAGPVRMVVPTSQIYLEPGEGLGTRGFDPSTQRTIYRYGRIDLPGSTALPAWLADRILGGARRYGGLSEVELRDLRVGEGW